MCDVVAYTPGASPSVCKSLNHGKEGGKSYHVIGAMEVQFLFRTVAYTEEQLKIIICREEE